VAAILAPHRARLAAREPLGPPAEQTQ
jgi:hypothetical protein